MYGGATFELAGNTVQLKRVSETTKGYGLAGSLSGFDYRIEHKSKDGVNQGVTFGQVSTKVGDMGVSYAMIDAESGNLVDENDSSIFAVEMGHSTVTGTTDDAQQQVTVTSSVDGNALTFKMGTIENAFSAGADMDYTQIMASRPLASGATATLTWTEQDTSATASKETFEIDLSVSF